MADPAPNLLRLYDHDGLLEEAFGNQFETQGIVALHSRSREDRPDSCALLQVDPGPSEGHAAPDAVTGTGGHEEDFFSAMVTLEITTERERERKSTEAGIVGRHAERVARARVAMLRGQLAETFACDYLDVVWISFAGQGRSFSSDTGSDVSTLAWAIKYRIRTDAWPTD